MGSTTLSPHRAGRDAHKYRKTSSRHTPSYKVFVPGDDAEKACRNGAVATVLASRLAEALEVEEPPDMEEEMMRPRLLITESTRDWRAEYQALSDSENPSKQPTASTPSKDGRAPEYVQSSKMPPTDAQPLPNASPSGHQRVIFHIPPPYNPSIFVPTEGFTSAAAARPSPPPIPLPDRTTDLGLPDIRAFIKGDFPGFYPLRDDMEDEENEEDEEEEMQQREKEWYDRRREEQDLGHYPRDRGGSWTWNDELPSLGDLSWMEEMEMLNDLGRPGRGYGAFAR